ncbi:MAG: DNA primase [Lentisphaerae bacterium]|nr:DNA primase [Lentisphaerota bacterium]
MAHIPEEIIDEIRRRADIVDVIGATVPLQRRGSDYWACCPFHQEKTPSFKVDQQRQTYYCFGCKKSGNVFHYVQESINTDFVGAVEWLADRLGIVIPERDSGDAAAAAKRREWRDNGMRLLDDCAAWFRQNMGTAQARQAHEYLRSREIDAEAVERFQLGYSPDSWDALCQWAQRQGYSPELLLATGMAIQKEGQKTLYDRFRGRLMFPIWDELGRVVGFSARVLDPAIKTAKYVNSPESDFFQKGSTLYAFNFARQSLKQFGHALVCEGQLDVIACHRAGLTHAIAAQGTAFTTNHARLLKRSTNEVVLAFDADSAGEEAVRRTVALLHGAGMSVSVVTLPQGEDPDSVFRKGGASALQQIMSNSQPAVPYLFQLSCARNDLTRPEELSAVVNEVLTAIKPIEDAVIRTAHCQWLSQQVNLPERVVFDALQTLRSERREFAQGGQGTPWAAKPPTMPAFVAPVVASEQTLQTLLDLILHHEAPARLLAAEQDVHEIIPDTPLGQAVMRVLAAVDINEWHDVEPELTQSDLVRDPLVGAVLAQTTFPGHTTLASPGDDATAEKHQRAYDDCLQRLRLERLNTRIEARKAQLATADGDEARQLQGELMELLCQKNQLRGAKR